MASSFENFAYTNGGVTKFQDIEGRLDSIGASLANSFLSNNTGSTAAQLLNLTISNPLPSGVPTGSIALSGSNAALRLYVYTGAGVAGWQSASLA
jgi:hypothetical protein